MTPHKICLQCRYYGRLSGNDRAIFCDHLDIAGKRREYDGDVCYSFAPKLRRKGVDNRKEG